MVNPWCVTKAEIDRAVADAEWAAINSWTAARASAISVERARELRAEGDEHQRRARALRDLKPDNILQEAR